MDSDLAFYLVILACTSALVGFTVFVTPDEGEPRSWLLLAAWGVVVVTAVAGWTGRLS